MDIMRATAAFATLADLASADRTPRLASLHAGPHALTARVAERMWAQQVADSRV